MSDDIPVHKSSSILIFQFLSVAAVAASCFVFIYQIRLLSIKKDILTFCDDLLSWMFLLTAIYVVVYVFIVIAYRILRSASPYEILAYFAYTIVMVLLVMAAFAIKDYFPLLSPFSHGIRLAWPSAILAILLLIFDLLIIMNQSLRTSTDPNDKYWYTIFSEAMKLDIAIILGFALLLYLLVVLPNSSYEGSPISQNSSVLVVFIAGSEIMLFLASVSVFAIDALLPIMRWPASRR